MSTFSKVSDHLVDFHSECTGPFSQKKKQKKIISIRNEIPCLTFKLPAGKLIATKNLRGQSKSHSSSLSIGANDLQLYLTFHPNILHFGCRNAKMLARNTLSISLILISNQISFRLLSRAASLRFRSFKMTPTTFELEFLLPKFK